MNIRFKLLSMFLFIIAILLAEIVAAWTVQFQLIEDYRELTGNLLTENTFTETIPELIDTYYLFVLAPTSQDRLDDYVAQRESINEALSQLDSKIVSDESKISYRGLRNVITNIISNCDKGVEAISAGDIKTASDYYNDGLNKKFYVTENTANLMISELHYAEKLQAEIDNTRNLVIISLAIISAIVLASCILLSLIFSKRITQPISGLSRIADRIAKDEKVKNVDESLTERNDEIGILSRSFGIMMKKLKMKIQELENAKDVAEKAKEDAEKSKKELESKVEELMQTKTAVLNMMEDTDEVNKKLVKTQEELKKSLDELKEIGVKKDQFISIAAHELKTPLTSIHGFSQLLQNRQVANNFTKRNKYLKIMDSETMRLAKLVTDILDLSRIDLGTLKLNFENVNINKLMEDIIKEMSIPIKHKKLDYFHEVEPDLPLINTDKEKVTQILVNLINNAMKYTPKGSISIKVEREMKNIHFMIKDTGIGISKENQEKVFERFYQVDSSYTRKVGGTGLGLSLCQEFVIKLGGKIWLVSELEKGSEFHFTVPIKKATSAYLSKMEKKADNLLKKTDRLRKESMKQKEEIAKNIEDIKE